MKNRQKFSYVAYFVSAEELAQKLAYLGVPGLEKPIACTHVTVEYKPEAVDQTLFGDRVTIRVVGYGKNEDNEGVKVEFQSENPVLQKMCRQIKVPHITLSISSRGSAVDTGILEFRPIEPFELTGVFGGYIKEKEMCVTG